MELYIFIAVIAYLAFAINGLIDKFLLTKSIPEPATYAFYIGALNAVALLLIPFGFHLPSVAIIILALISGFSFVYALIAMFTALKEADATLVLPGIGAAVPVFTLILSFMALDEHLSLNILLGIFALVFGTILVALTGRARKKRSKWLSWALIAGFLFALSFITAKLVYLDQGFVSGLVWTRIGFIVGALSIIASPQARKKIFKISRAVSKPAGTLFIIGQVMGAGASVLQNYAVSLGSVTVVNALQGTQFAFLIVLTWVLYRWFPKVLAEDFSFVIIVRKFVAVILIGLGLILISI